MNTKLRNTYNRMHSSILSNDASIAAPDIKNHLRLTPEQQLSIYIEGYRLRLMAAVRSDFPALAVLLGDKVFDALALEYVEKNPSGHYNLDRYPHYFPVLVKEKSGTGFAAELALVEGVIAEVFMGEESEPLDPYALSQLTPEGFGAFRFTPRKASRLLSLDYPVNEWLLAQRAGVVPDAPQPQKNYLYAFRHNNSVQREMLSAEAMALLTPLLAGLAVGEALEAAVQKNPAAADVIAAQLQHWFSDWVGKGFFAGV